MFGISYLCTELCLYSCFFVKHFNACFIFLLLSKHACFVYEIMFGKMAGSGQPKQQVENETHAIETTVTSARKTEY